ncbi:hypothetical protein H8K38_09025 [Undibacterium sp. FT79W]|uniref:hypothetical protein n=1 Tax=Undibacterium sp. FT79W TaxID=2762296 RepID=UPI00164C627B|nr:hypothetical protein [Undibacterium sp. FT79W]MBC3877950.1 hypothetical protein [Undibacterium sp. FT79W]
MSDQMTEKHVTHYVHAATTGIEINFFTINLSGIALEYDAGDRYDFWDTVINLRRFIQKMRRINA